MSKRTQRKKNPTPNRPSAETNINWNLLSHTQPQPTTPPFFDFLGNIHYRDGLQLGLDVSHSSRFQGVDLNNDDGLVLSGDTKELGSAIDLGLFEKWRGRVSDNLGLDTELCLLSDFANDKMLWKRVVARVRLESLYKPRFGKDGVSWSNWFVENAKIVEDRNRGVWDSEIVKKAEYEGPFGEAYKRAVKRREKEKADKDKGVVKWTPVERKVGVYVPSLADLSFAFLAEYLEGLVSLENVPLEIRHKLCRAACDYGKMNFEFMKVVVAAAPSEICVPDCCWMTTKQFIDLFCACDGKNLKILHLASCVQCDLDHALASEVFIPGVFRALTSLSLKGAVQLTDKGLGSLVQLAPSLRSLDISQCPLISSIGINILVIWYGKTLEELCIDDCTGIDAVAMLPALTQFLSLQVLSVAGNSSVSDEFVRHFVDARGSFMKELVFSSCKRLTDQSVKVIGNAGSALDSLHISNISNLTDWALQYIANGVGSLRHLELSHNAFSDEAVAALLEVSGQNLTDLSIKNMPKIGPATAFALANFTRNLLSLDISQCEHITENMLGQIVNCCTSLRLLKLFGCSQITNRLINGHTNTNLEIVGASSSLLQESVP